MEHFERALANREASLHLLVEFVQTEVRVARVMIHSARLARVERVRVKRLAHAKRACEVAASALKAHQERIAQADLVRLATELADVCAQIDEV